MFEPNIESEVWMSLEEHNVTVWKLFSSSRVHFVRFKDLHIFMLVEKKYPLTPATITGMLNKKLQVDQWNEMSYQLLKLLVKQQKNPGISAAYTKVNAAGMKVTTAKRLQLLEEFLLGINNNMVKIMTTPDARTEGQCGFEHTKDVFNNEIIPFNVFDKNLLNEIMEAQTVFDQMEAVVQQYSVDKQCLEIAEK
ncbi:hypothetical protein Tco_0365705 [Tanacetum coccineum]